MTGEGILAGVLAEALLQESPCSLNFFVSQQRASGKFTSSFLLIWLISM